MGDTNPEIVLSHDQVRLNLLVEEDAKCQRTKERF